MLSYRTAIRQSGAATAPAPGTGAPTLQNAASLASSMTSSATESTFSRSSSLVAPQTSAARASRAQYAGFAALDDMHRMLTEMAKSSSHSTLDDLGESNTFASSASQDTQPEETEEEREARLLAEDEAAVSAELERYLTESLTSDDVVLLDYWNVRRLLLHVLILKLLMLRYPFCFRITRPTTRYSSEWRSTFCPLPPLLSPRSEYSRQAKRRMLFAAAVLTQPCLRCYRS